MIDVSRWHGRMISIEGLDGCGKTTQVAKLTQRFNEVGIPAKSFREPGSTTAGEQIRRILLDPETEMGFRCEMLLYSAARAEIHEKVIFPILRNGDVVVMDRWAWSTMAYQGCNVGIDDITNVTTAATGGVFPDHTIILDLDPAQASARMHSSPDRIEQRGLEYFKGVRQRYRELPTRFQNVTIMDAMLPPDELANEIWGFLMSCYLPPKAAL